MSRHRVIKKDWAVLDLDTQEGCVLVQQRWEYQWLVDPYALGYVVPWTYREKRVFMAKLINKFGRSGVIVSY
jgi:hypothetical protein